VSSSSTISSSESGSPSARPFLGEPRQDVVAAGGVAARARDLLGEQRRQLGSLAHEAAPRALRPEVAVERGDEREQRGGPAGERVDVRHGAARGVVVADAEDRAHDEPQGQIAHGVHDRELAIRGPGRDLLGGQLADEARVGRQALAAQGRPDEAAVAAVALAVDDEERRLAHERRHGRERGHRGLGR
jgi:hypothetical protein